MFSQGAIPAGARPRLIDTLKRREEVAAFMAGGLATLPGAYARTARAAAPLAAAAEAGRTVA